CVDGEGEVVGGVGESERLLPVAFVGNDGLGSALIQLLSQFGAVVGFVAEHAFRRLGSADQALGYRAIVRFTASQQDGDQAPFSICECVNLRIAPSARGISQEWSANHPSSGTREPADLSESARSASASGTQRRAQREYPRQALGRAAWGDDRGPGPANPGGISAREWREGQGDRGGCGAKAGMRHREAWLAQAQSQDAATSTC